MTIGELAQPGPIGFHCPYVERTAFIGLKCHQAASWREVRTSRLKKRISELLGGSAFEWDRPQRALQIDNDSALIRPHCGRHIGAFPHRDPVPRYNHRSPNTHAIPAY